MTYKNTLSQFAIHIWKDKKIEKECINLQETYNINVVSFLWVLWIEQNGYYVSDKIINNLIIFCKEYEDNYIKPLRQNRKIKKSNNEDYQDILNNEIQQEMKLLKILENKYIDELTTNNQQFKKPVNIYSDITGIKISEVFSR